MKPEKFEALKEFKNFVKFKYNIIIENMFCFWIMLNDLEISGSEVDVCILSDRMSQIRFALFVGSDFFDSIGGIVECRIFDIRSTLLRIGFFRFDRPHSRMSNIRHPKCLNSDIEHSMSAGCSLQLLTRHHTIYIHCIIVLFFWNLYARLLIIEVYRYKINTSNVIKKLLTSLWLL